MTISKAKLIEKIKQQWKDYDALNKAHQKKLLIFYNKFLTLADLKNVLLQEKVEFHSLNDDFELTSEQIEEKK